MYKIPKDIEVEMNKIYPNIDVQLFVHQLFTKIVDKTFRDGACSIREIGKFVAFKMFSTRLNRETVKFKFKSSISMLKRIRFDEYLLNLVNISQPVEFNEEHEQICSDKREIKKLRNKVYPIVNKSEREGTKKHLAKLEILKVLEENND